MNGLAQRGGSVALQPQLLLDLVVRVRVRVRVLGAGAVGLHSHGLDAHVGSATAGALAQLGAGVGPGVVEGLHPQVLAGLAQPFGDAVDDDHPLGAEQHRGAGGDLPDGACSPHRDDVPGPDTAEVGAHPPGRTGVGGEHRGQVVVQPVRYREAAVVGEGHPDVLGVGAGQAARHGSSTQPTHPEITTQEAARPWGSRAGTTLFG